MPKGCKTLVFEDKVFDRQHGEVVTRKLTVTGSDAYGLPTAVDDEVLVALLQLTKLDGFRDPKVISAGTSSSRSSAGRTSARTTSGSRRP